MTKIKKPLETVESAAEKSICELCGDEFSCGAKIGECWCFAVELNSDALAKMRDNFKDCLCGDCLRKLK